MSRGCTCNAARSPPTLGGRGRGGLDLLGRQLYRYKFAFGSVGLRARMSFLYLDSCCFHLPIISLLVSEGGRAQAAGFLGWGYGAGLPLPTLEELVLSRFPSHQAPGRKALGTVSENCEVLIKTVFPPALLVSLLKHVRHNKTVIDGLLRKCWSPHCLPHAPTT